MNASATPASLGYRWPAEWEPHAATWVSWPHNLNSWPGKFEPIPGHFAQLVKTLAEFEPVHILAGGDEVMAEADGLVGGLANITLHDIPTNDAWCRDHGPIFLIGPADDRPALIDWRYNAWGNKYSPYNEDDEVPLRIATLQNRLRFAPDMVLEGGAIEGNGGGTILTTRQCLLNPNRNPTLSVGQIERYLFDYLTARKVLWLSGGELAGDDTDGHIDQLARFVNPTTIVAASEPDASESNYEPLRRNLAELREMTDQDGHAFDVVQIPMPRPKSFNNHRLPASYLNFYIANGVVVVPQFDDPADKMVVQILEPLFSGRQIIGLPALDLVWGLGAFHCLTQQEPKWYETGDDAGERVEG